MSHFTLVARLTASAFLFPSIQALNENRISEEIRLHAFQLLRKLAGESRQVPKSCLIGKLTSYRVERTVFARGGFADIRQGRLKGMAVAVKTVRAPRERIGAIHEAR